MIEKNQELKDLVEELNNEFYGSHDFVQTSSCGRGQHHLHGLVGKLWKINNPDTIRIGHCFLAGRLKKGDLFLCYCHSGDCFQYYMYVEEYSNAYVGRPKWAFGSYGIGDSTTINITNEDFEKLKKGELVKKCS